MDSETALVCCLLRCAASVIVAIVIGTTIYNTTCACLGYGPTLEIKQQMERK